MVAIHAFVLHLSIWFDGVLYSLEVCGVNEGAFNAILRQHLLEEAVRACH